MIKTYSDYVKKQMAKLKDYDHKLFEDIVNGLKKEGWKEEGGSDVFRLLNKGSSAITMFRNAEVPEVIHIRFSAPPEEENLIDWEAHIKNPPKPKKTGKIKVLLKYIGRSKPSNCDE